MPNCPGPNPEQIRGTQPPYPVTEGFATRWNTVTMVALKMKAPHLL